MVCEKTDDLDVAFDTHGLKFIAHLLPAIIIFFIGCETGDSVPVILILYLKILAVILKQRCIEFDPLLLISTCTVQLCE